MAGRAQKYEIGKDGGTGQRISIPSGDVDSDNNPATGTQPEIPHQGQRVPLTDHPEFRRGEGDTIISVPRDGQQTAEIRQAPGIVSLPGDSVNVRNLKATGYKSASKPSVGSPKPIEIVIYFMDKTGINLTVEDGQHATAGELFEMVMDEMKFPHEAREAFSLWLVSDLLEVQLKPDHVPFKLVCYWEELLEKYTNAMEDDRERDEPVLMFQRNVFFHRSDEKKITNAKLIYLLYNEAKEAVVDGRYALQSDEYDYLAGLQALIKHKGYNDNEHKADYYRSRKHEYYPEHLCRSKWSLPGFGSGSGSVEQRLAESHAARERDFRSQRAVEQDDEAWKVGLQRAYLDFCRKLPFYGAAFFKGQIEHPGSARFRFKTINDDPVYVAVNTEGVSVIEMDEVKFLLYLRYQQMSWEYAEPQDKDNPDCMPCLFLQFPTTENGEDVTKLLQVFAREASLMDAMIDACVKVKKQELRQYGDTVDGAQDKGLMQTQGEMVTNFGKMCLATFDRSGRCRSYSARTPKPDA